MNGLLKLFSAPRGGKVAFDGSGAGKDGWITMNGTPVKVDDKGEAVAGPANVVAKGQKQTSAKSVEEKRTAVKDAMRKISAGSKEETIPDLRDDLEQYGGTNDVTLMRGTPGHKGSGLDHIVSEHGEGVIPGVLDAVIEGKVLRAPEVNGKVYKVTVQKGDYEAVLSLNEHGKKKTWLLTGFDTTIPKGQKAESKQAPVGDSKFSPRHVPTQTGPMFSRPGLGADASFREIVAQIFRKSTRSDRIAFDRASRRHFDANGFLHVSRCHISKEQVADYYGAEIPGWRNLGLDPDRVYKGYRPGRELARAVDTFNGLPLLAEHMKDSAEEPQKELRIGNLGTDAAWSAPYLDNSLVIQDAEAIEALNPKDGGVPKRELSASYRYDPVFEPGAFGGQHYDFIMTNIRGNHVAIVEEGRAGSDVVVADAKPIKPIKRGGTMAMDLKALLEQLLAALGGGQPPAPAALPFTVGEWGAAKRLIMRIAD